MATSVYKVIELVGSSTESWEKAAQAAVETASRSIRDMRVAEVVKQKNVYRVEVELAEPVDWQIGLEGLAHLHIDERPYGWLWTHRLVKWARMKFWW